MKLRTKKSKKAKLQEEENHESDRSTERVFEKQLIAAEQGESDGSSDALKKSKKEKRKRRKSTDEETEELEIDVNAPEPLSKKQKRLLKKGKINETKEPTAKPVAGSKRSEYGVWIGNMSFETDKSELRRFLILKSQDSSTPITDESITRLNIPRKQGGKSSGFAYVDFTTPEHVQTAISLSEQNLNGRNLLIKDAHSFEGRPAKVDSSNPPSRILFIGNLSFETSEDDLTSHFQHCGEIGRIRMATFEDTGKCKGFAFIDFKDVEGATAALTDKKCRKLLGRDLRMEYGEDRSKRKPKSKTTESDSVEDSSETKAPISSPVSEPAFDRRKPKGPRSANGRRTPGAALANAQRATSAIVESTGKKVTFD